MRPRTLSLTALIVFFAGTAISRAQVSGNGAITGTIFGSPVTLKTSSQYGGAINSMVWNGKEFVNNFDHGRQFSVNASFFNRYECYNPYETGTRADGDGPTSSSKVLSLNASGNTLESGTQMSFYLNTREPREGFGDECGNPAEYFWQVPSYTGPLSNYVFHKTVTIGFAGIQNVIEYRGTLSIPEVVYKGVVQMTTLLPWEFNNLFAYDLASQDYRSMRVHGGEDDSVKVLATADGSYAMGHYTPELLQPYGNGRAGGYGWGLVPPDPVNFPDPNFACASMTAGYRFDSAAPGDFNHRSYFVIGNLEQVRTGLAALHSHFSPLDPDVFNWQVYVSINKLDVGASFDQLGAENHWMSTGIAQGKNASTTFSPSQYLALNPDIAQIFGPTNYQAAIQHYVSTGRSEGRGTVATPSAGMQHLMVTTNRNVTASGQNVFGQLGTAASPLPPTPISSLDNSVTEIAAGDYTSFAVKNDGSLWVWGSNQYGARGDGSSGDNLSVPVQVPLPFQVTTPKRGGKRAVAVGTAVYAAIDTQGQVWTWGANWNGRLGDGTTTSRFTPARVRKSAIPGDYLTGIVTIAAAGGTLVAVDADSSVWTWGTGANGALGNGAIEDSTYPVQVLRMDQQNLGVPLVAVTQVAGGSSGFCLALTRYGQVYGWGSNAFSQLGLPGGGALSIATPIEIKPGFSIDRIAAGSAHAIAHCLDGNVYGWGYNGRGQLGTGSAGVAQSSPIPMSRGPDGMDDIGDIAAGPNYSVMVRYPDRGVFVTGDNQSGQLGIPGNVADQKVPVRSAF
jgi:alpha-tubulin suppressor-like RCC1 family protein